MTPAPAYWLARLHLPALEIGHQLGYAAVVLDMEHGALTAESCDALVGLAKALGLQSIVRVADTQRILVQQALDCGADAVMLPMVQHAAHASQVAGYAKYRPEGTHEVGSARAFGYGSYTSLDERVFRRANAETRCYVMIETEAALIDVDKIAALSQVDGLFIVPSDLSLARGRGAFRFTPADEADLATVAEACHKAPEETGPAGSNTESNGACAAARGGFRDNLRRPDRAPLRTGARVACPSAPHPRSGSQRISLK
jgi:4-hydroxy-2-oxoheptanedioate aldolase